MKKLTKLIDEYLLQITIFIFFLTLTFLLPLSSVSVPENYQLKVLTVRCLVLDILSIVVFAIFGKEKRRFLSLFPAGGVLFSTTYMLFKDKLSLLLLVSFTVTAVISTSLLAFTLIKVRFNGVD
ncbi:hypothetical protein [Phorcysia thermohydrogeniphila]|nr:hypothetical protein [Phorcysia thermohydrogeniphila]